MNYKRNLDWFHTGKGDSFESLQYKKFSNKEYEIFFQPLTIKKYLKKLITIQKIEEYSFFPCKENLIREYFQEIDKNFDYNNIKFSNKSNLQIISCIISNMGKSGFNFINSVDNLIYLNKPVLLFYGIEHLSSYYLNMHFNFTEENRKLKSLKNKRKIFLHGIDSNEFKNKITLNSKASEILNYKIKLKKFGLASRFFLSLGFPIKEYFIKKKEITLIELLQTFFFKTRIGIPDNLKNAFREDLSKFFLEPLDYNEDIDLFVFYLMSFIFSHLSRYKMYIWKKLLSSEEYNIGFFLKYIIDVIKNLYIRKIFSLIYYYNNEFKRLINVYKSI